MMNDGKKDFVAIRQDSSFKLLRATSKTTGDIFNNINYLWTLTSGQDIITELSRDKKYEGYAKFLIKESRLIHRSRKYYKHINKRIVKSKKKAKIE